MNKEELRDIFLDNADYYANTLLASRNLAMTGHRFVKVGCWYINIPFDEKDNPYYQWLLSIGYVYKEVILCNDNKNRIIRKNPPVYFGMLDNTTVKFKKEPNENPTMKKSILCVETFFI